MNEDIGQLLDMARRCEVRAAETYRHFAEKFAINQEASEFWRTLSAEEIEHAEFIEYLAGGMSEEIKSREPSVSQLDPVEKLLQYMASHPYHEVNTIEQAYRYTERIENYEVTSIVQLMASRYIPMDTRNEMLHKQLTDHYCRVHSFMSKVNRKGFHEEDME